jgi:hypothetical protein
MPPTGGALVVGLSVRLACPPCRAPLAARGLAAVLARARPGGSWAVDTSGHNGRYEDKQIPQHLLDAVAGF